MDIKLVRSTEEFLAYEKDLLILESCYKKSELYTSFLWLKSWLNVYDKDLNLIILIFYENNKIVAFLPLMITISSYFKIPVKRVELISIGTHGNLFDFPHLIDFKSIWSNALQFLKESNIDWDVILFEGVDEANPLIEEMSESTKLMGLHFQSGSLIEELYDWYLLISENWEMYYKSLSSNLKKSINNKRNKMKKFGGFEILNLKQNDNLDLFWHLVRKADQGSWQFENQCGITSPQNEDFYYLLAKEFFGNGTDIWILKINDKPTAFEFSIIYSQKVYALRWGYHQEYKDFAPGKVLRIYSLEHYFNSEVTEYDFLGKYDDFKKKWNTEFRKVVQLFVFNNSIHGNLAHSLGFNLKLHHLKNRIKKIGH